MSASLSVVRPFLSALPPIRKLTDLLLYGNFWIAACAVAQVMFTYAAVGAGRGFDLYTDLVFSGTLFIYSAHTILGTHDQRTGSLSSQRRFVIMQRYAHHILCYCLLGLTGMAYFAFHLTLSTLALLLLPLLLSVSYVLPLSSGLSIRGLPYVKNVVVALCWSMATTWVPLTHLGIEGPAAPLIFFERFFFLFALTIPFEIRDVTYDRRTTVRTIPHRLGHRGSKRLAAASIGMAMVLVIWLTYLGVYVSEALIAYSLSAAIALVLIQGSHRHRDDYYYTGLVDGVMIVQPLVLALLTL